MQTPNQDSVAVERAGPNGLVAAVADGHGHSRHLRSARGSRFAVGIGCRVGQEVADQLIARAPGLAEAETGSAGPAGPGSAITAEEIIDLVQDFLIPSVVGRWREAVLADVAADPFTESEHDQRRPGDDPTIAYGSTLLLCVALREWLILAQIGDGDVVGVRADGTATLPVPADPQLDGLVTTSLCGPDAAADFRIGVVNITQTPLLATLLATDGYGNAQVAERWPDSFSKDMAWLLRERDTRWLASQLPGWAARCASAEGSADDTTVALLISPAGQASRTITPPGGGGAGGAASEAGGQAERDADEITIPAVPRADTVPSGQVPSRHGPDGPAAPTEPITVRLATQAAAGQPEPGPVAGEPPVPGITDQVTAEWDPPGRSAGSGVR